MQRQSRSNPFPPIESIQVNSVERAPRRNSERAESGAAKLPGRVSTFAPESADVTILLEEKYQEGVSAGLQQAHNDLEQEYAALLEKECQERVAKEIAQLEDLLATIQREWSRARAKTAETVTRMSIVVAEQIMKQEIKLDNSIVLNQVREALQHVTGVEHIKLRVNPADEAIIREYKVQLMSGSDSIRDLQITGDENVCSGGCILESDSGTVDATLETQLKKIVNILQDERTTIK